MIWIELKLTTFSCKFSKNFNFRLISLFSNVRIFKLLTEFISIKYPSPRPGSNSEASIVIDWWSWKEKLTSTSSGAKLFVQISTNEDLARGFLGKGCRVKAAAEGRTHLSRGWRIDLIMWLDVIECSLTIGCRSFYFFSLSRTLIGGGENRGFDWTDWLTHITGLIKLN